MAQVCLTLQYDGTQYHGWQVQPNGVTVQQVLQDAIQTVTGIRASVTGCSRTDSGVHAHRFYCRLCEAFAKGRSDGRTAIAISERHRGGIHAALLYGDQYSEHDED